MTAQKGLRNPLFGAACENILPTTMRGPLGKLLMLGPRSPSQREPTVNATGKLDSGDIVYSVEWPSTQWRCEVQLLKKKGCFDCRSC
ncbi:hypothetical protein JTE90_021470 [Oedothorax gibbosus]|uniref:Uncharacterized protein n=1 Tax=Oedothorax gibbosus TaxID=931172 RepID=A0AAV6VY58_9ARAC|nr:hypothetical protein JTE90_021470 [Oedothorax gibbosus]